MLTLISGLPANVVGVKAQDKVTAEDYEQVLIPAVEAAQAATADGKIRILYVLAPEFPDYSAGAAWEDAKLGLGKFKQWERIAVVSDAEWLRHAFNGLGWIMPGEVKLFGSSDLAGARAWVITPA